MASLQLAADAAKLDPELSLVESTLRSALLATRELRVLDAGDAQTRPAGAPAGGGRRRHPDAQRELQPDGSLIVITGGTGARLVHTGSGELFGTLATGSP